ncbi:MAG: rhodanese-related sulfurtransferase [Acidimicrobiia bacterium]
MFSIAALYHFSPIQDLVGTRQTLLAACTEHGVKGTLLLASEGLNGTIASEGNGVRSVVDAICALPGFENTSVKWATADADPFLRLKVRLKREIVTLGVGEVDTPAHTGTHVPASEWNALISRPDVIVVDTRNDYEVAIGTFEGAVDPGTKSFTEFPAWIDNAADIDKDTPLAMFCTGGIRCEKATAYLTEQGFTNLFQLDGGILRYLEEVDEPESMWDGECYVFDRRVSVGHGLVPGGLEICPNCNSVIGDAAREAEGYAVGITCPVCVDTISADRYARFAERQKQVELAEARGTTHLGRPA